MSAMLRIVLMLGLLHGSTVFASRVHKSRVKARLGSVLADSPSVFNLWGAGAQNGACDKCMDVPISELLTEGEDGYLGCDPQFTEGQDSFPVVPTCRVKEGVENIQAGGHADTFHVLQDNKVAKQVLAFDKLSDGASGKEKRNKIAARTEYEVYMNFWCLKKLKNPSLNLTTYPGAESLQKSSAPHPLENFALGSNPWAPAFFGLCKVQYGESSSAYIMMENLMGLFRKPSQLDLKVGRTIEPDAADEQGYRKVWKKQIFDYFSPTLETGARLAGYKVWDHKEKKYESMSSKAFSPLMSLSSVFSHSFDERHWANEDEMLTTYSNRIEKMALWWNKEALANKLLHSIAASLLFIYEGAEDGQDKAPPVVKIIDYAHFFPFETHPDWPEDLTFEGLTSTVGELDEILGNDAAISKHIFKDTSPEDMKKVSAYKEKCGGSATACLVKCPEVLENPDSDTKLHAFFGVSKARCKKFATEMNKKYFCWRRYERGECRVCDTVVPRNDAMIASWSKGWDLYESELL